MSDSQYASMQRMELNALRSIFGQDFRQTAGGDDSDVLPVVDVTVFPLPTLPEEENHVGVRLTVSFTATYPDEVPKLAVAAIRGLKPEAMKELVSLASKTAEDSLGEGSVFVVVEAIREWLQLNNKRELSMHEQTLADIERRRANLQSRDMSSEEKQARRRLLEQKSLEEDPFQITDGPSPLGIQAGQLVTKESFAQWKKQFDAEHAGIAKEEAKKRAKETGENRRKRNKETGREFFEKMMRAKLGIEPDDIEKKTALNDENVQIDDDLFMNAEEIDDDLFLDDEHEGESSKPSGTSEPVHTSSIQDEGLFVDDDDEADDTGALQPPPQTTKSEDKDSSEKPAPEAKNEAVPASSEDNETATTAPEPSKKPAKKPVKRLTAKEKRARAAARRRGKKK